MNCWFGLLLVETALAVHWQPPEPSRREEESGEEFGEESSEEFDEKSSEEFDEESSEELGEVLNTFSTIWPMSSRGFVSIFCRSS